jgi:dTDP-4-dehydrorhamnose 3,5-epimerase-like enzyme
MMRGGEAQKAPGDAICRPGDLMSTATPSIVCVKPLTAHTTPIPRLTLFAVPVQGDNQGWFKENWKRQKVTELGLPELEAVQNNVSAVRGAIRGVHAESRDKYIWMANASVFGAW